MEKKCKKATPDVRIEYHDIMARLYGMDPKSEDFVSTCKSLHKLINNYCWDNEVYEENGKVGLKTVFGKVLVPAMFDYIVPGGSYFRQLDKIHAIYEGSSVLVNTDGSGNYVPKKANMWLRPVMFEVNKVTYDPIIITERRMMTLEGVVDSECDNNDDYDEEFISYRGTEYTVVERNHKYGLCNGNVTTDVLFKRIFFEYGCPIKVYFDIDGEPGYITENGEYTTDENRDNLWRIDSPYYPCGLVLDLSCRKINKKKDYNGQPPKE